MKTTKEKKISTHKQKKTIRPAFSREYEILKDLFLYF